MAKELRTYIPLQQALEDARNRYGFPEDYDQSVLLAKENEDGYILLGTIILMPDRSNDADKTEKKSDGKADK